MHHPFKYTTWLLCRVAKHMRDIFRTTNENGLQTYRLWCLELHLKIYMEESEDKVMMRSESSRQPQFEFIMVIGCPSIHGYLSMTIFLYSMVAIS